MRRRVWRAHHNRTGLHRARGETTKAVERSHVPAKDRLRPMRGLQSIATGQHRPAAARRRGGGQGDPPRAHRGHQRPAVNPPRGGGPGAARRGCVLPPGRRPVSRGVAARSTQRAPSAGAGSGDAAHRNLTTFRMARSEAAWRSKRRSGRPRLRYASTHASARSTSRRTRPRRSRDSTPRRAIRGAMPRRHSAPLRTAERTGNRGAATPGWVSVSRSLKPLVETPAGPPARHRPRHRLRLWAGFCGPANGTDA